MTGRLHVRYSKYLQGDSVDQCVVANINAIAPGDTGRPSGKTRQDVLLPSGSADRLKVDLDPGRYVVEAVLPSGDIVSDEVEVLDNRDVELDLRGEESPHEWLSWHQFMGNVDKIEQYPWGIGISGVAESAVYWVTDPVPPLQGGEPSGVDAWGLLTQLANSPGEPIISRLAQGAPERIPPFMDDDQVELYQTVAEGPWMQWDLPTDGGSSPAPRRYLVVDAEGGTDLVCVPVPWINLKTNYEVPVQILVHKLANKEDPAVAVTIRDPLIGSALGYMTLGALPSAERLFDRAKQMLLVKQVNPLGAAGGGYVLLATERGSQQKEWHPWIENLMNFFDWLPDGAIQQGWLKLRHRGSQADLREAREALFTAYRRGLPFYSVGLQWLIDGLTLFASNDATAADMLENVRRVAWQTNMQEPFTVVRLRQA